MAYTAWSVVYGEQPTAAKWNQLGANDAGFKDGTNIDAGAITETKLAASSVTNAKLSTATDEIGAAWKSWSPTLGNGGGTISGSTPFAKYMRIGKTILWRINISVTSVSAGGSVNFTAPVASAAAGQYAGAGREDSLTGKITECMFKSSTTVISLFYFDNTGNTASNGANHFASGTYESV